MRKAVGAPDHSTQMDAEELMRYLITFLARRLSMVVSGSFFLATATAKNVSLVTYSSVDRNGHEMLNEIFYANVPTTELVSFRDLFPSGYA